LKKLSREKANQVTPKMGQGKKRSRGAGKKGGEVPAPRPKGLVRGGVCRGGKEPFRGPGGGEKIPKKDEGGGVGGGGRSGSHRTRPQLQNQGKKRPTYKKKQNPWRTKRGPNLLEKTEVVEHELGFKVKESRAKLFHNCLTVF